MRINNAANHRIDHPVLERAKTRQPMSQVLVCVDDGTNVWDLTTGCNISAADVAALTASNSALLLTFTAL